jgi:hypothetical protein
MLIGRESNKTSSDDHSDWKYQALYGRSTTASDGVLDVNESEATVPDTLQAEDDAQSAQAE